MSLWQHIKKTLGLGEHGTGAHGNLGGFVSGNNPPIYPGPYSTPDTPTAEDAGATIATGQLAVTATVQQLIPTNPNRRNITIRNADAAAILYVGPAGVTTATGQSIGPGQTLPLKTRAAIFAVGSGALTASYIEESI